MLTDFFLFGEDDCKDVIEEEAFENSGKRKCRYRIYQAYDQPTSKTPSLIILDAPSFAS